MKYYVYQLADPRDGKPFYIGKGCGNRSSDHVKQAEAGALGRKCYRIRKIIKDGFRPLIEHLAYFEHEQHAIDFEAMLISQVGKGKLTNVMARGSVSAKHREPKLIVVPRIRFFLGPYTKYFGSSPPREFVDDADFELWMRRHLKRFCGLRSPRLETQPVSEKIAGIDSLYGVYIDGRGRPYGYTDVAVIFQNQEAAAA